MSFKKYSPKSVGILLVIVDSFFFSLMTLFVRLAGDLPTMQKTFFRNAVAGVIALFILGRTPEKFRIRKGSLPLLVARSLSGGLGMIANFWAIDHIALADANILNKMSPFFAILFSLFLLKEIPTLSDWIALVIAFIGAALVVKPGADILQAPALVALLGGMGAGFAYTCVRKLGGRKERGPVIVAFFSVFTSLMCAPFMVRDYKPMSLWQWFCLLGAGSCAAIAQFAVTAAYKFAPAREISVFDYSQVLFASLWGILLLGEFPDGISIAGYVLIIGCAVGRWYRLQHSHSD